ncbi:hypothetical protein D0C37_29115 [Streptomyces koyangensis]|uniref:Uncharacterized protein n=1 Tax=Streptomyces koyangensis TaxID=188770 RepID=A0A385DK15_9ACTN|nr:hypothetical protein D0C37_29115 [Streptomyces koyangensis]PKR46225.1 hypothetical protein CWE27_04865 [Streptomyces sp. EAG2]
MTSSPSANGRRRHGLTVPSPSSSEESVPPVADPPIYRALFQQWARHGRTLPGRRDPEWSRLAAAPVFRFSGSPARPGDGR